MTERFKLFLYSTSYLLAALAVGAVLSASASHAREQPRATGAFIRGINVTDYLAYPSSDEWPLFGGAKAAISDAELARLADIGFTFVRLPVEPGPFLDLPVDKVSRLDQRLVSFVARAHAAGLGVMVSGFPRFDKPRWRPEDILRDPESSAFERYGGFLQRLAGLLQKAPGGAVALELMNEPQAECRRPGGHDWTGLQLRLYAKIRAVSDTLPVVLTGGCWSGIDGMESLDLQGYDSNTLVDVHYYEPFSFTHQGATWTLPELKSLAGLSFPARRTDATKAREAIARRAIMRHPRDRRAQRVAYSLAVRKLDAYLRDDPDADTVSRHMNRIARWADRMEVSRHRIIVGEFGALRPYPESKAGDNRARARWLKAVREAAEKAGFGWSLWGWNGAFGLLTNDGKGPLDTGMVRALGLTVPATEMPVNQSIGRGRGESVIR